MKILHMLDSQGKGGAEMLTLDLCRNAKHMGLDIVLITSNKSIMNDEFRSTGIELINVDRTKPIDFKLILKLRRIIKKNGISIIHSHQAVDGIHGYLAGFGKKLKYVLTFHGHIPSKKDDATLKFLIPRMSANIAVSKAFLYRLKNEIKFDTTKNFHVIYNGIDKKKFFKTNKMFRSELKISNDELLLGMIGNFYNNGRDQLTICKALPDIFDRYSNVHFVFVGGRSESDPHFYDECFNLCKENNILDRTHFVGLRSDINDILNSLDIFVFSSNHDTFGIAVVEAMLSNLPVIVNDLSPLMEVTNNGRYAKLFKSRDVNDLKEKYGKEKLTVQTNKKVKIDFEISSITFDGKDYSIDPVGEAAQELIVDGGLEEWVKKNI